MEISDERLTALEQKLEMTYKSTEKTRKYILSMLIVTVVTVVLPIIGLVFVLPFALNALTAGYGGI